MWGPGGRKGDDAGKRLLCGAPRPAAGPGSPELGAACPWPALLPHLPAALLMATRSAGAGPLRAGKPSFVWCSWPPPGRPLRCQKATRSRLRPLPANVRAGRGEAGSGGCRGGRPPQSWVQGQPAPLREAAAVPHAGAMISPPAPNTHTQTATINARSTCCPPKKCSHGAQPEQAAVSRSCRQVGHPEAARRAGGQRGQSAAGPGEHRRAWACLKGAIAERKMGPPTPTPPATKVGLGPELAKGTAERGPVLEGCGDPSSSEPLPSSPAETLWRIRLDAAGAGGHFGLPSGLFCPGPVPPADLPVACLVYAVFTRPPCHTAPGLPCRFAPLTQPPLPTRLCERARRRGGPAPPQKIAVDADAHPRLACAWLLSRPAVPRHNTSMQCHRSGQGV